MINIDKILDVLNEIGLSERESLVYTTCLQMGKQTVSVISRLTNIRRATVYDVLDKLIKKGIAHRVEGVGTTYFEVLDGYELLRYVEAEKIQNIYNSNLKIERLKGVLTDLEELSSFSPSKPMVKYYEGERGLQEAYEDTLTSSEDIRAYANIEEMHKGLPHFFPDYYSRRCEAGLFIHTISPDNKISIERSKFDKKEMREIRFIDSNVFEFTPEINIYDHKVLFASWKEKMAVIIESEEIADFQKKIFDVLYEKLGHNFEK